MKILLKVFVLSLLFSFSQVLTAQESNQGKFNLGFDGGVQFTNVEDRTTINPAERKIGYTFGPYAEYFISDLFTVKLGVYFDNRGFKIDDLYVGYADTSQLYPDSVVYSADSYLHITRDYSMNYLTVPLSISYVKGSEKFKIFVQLGVYYSILLNAHKKGYNDLYIDPVYEPHFNLSGHQIEYFDEDATTLFNSFDVGMNLYLGGLIKLYKNWSLSVTPGFQFSFTHLYYRPDIDASWRQIFQIKAGVVYTLSKK